MALQLLGERTFDRFPCYFIRYKIFSTYNCENGVVMKYFSILALAAIALVLPAQFNASQLNASEAEPLICYKPLDTFLYRAEDFTYVGPAYAMRGYNSTIIFELSDEASRRIPKFDQKHDGETGAMTFFSDLILPLTGFTAGSAERSEFFTFGLPGLPEIFAISDRINTAREDPKTGKKVVMTLFVARDKITITSDKIAKMAYYPASHSSNIQPKSEEIGRKLLDKIGTKKSIWRCFVAGREASDWSYDPGTSPPFFHFKRMK